MATQPLYVRGDEGIEALRTGQAPREDRSGLIPRFFILQRGKEDGSLAEIECVEIIVPGDTKTVSIRKVTEKERQMFIPEYEAFKKGEGFEIEGTRLSLWLGKDDPRIPELHYHKVMTVEQLANITDTQVQGMGMGFRALRDQANMFVAQRTGPEAMMAQNENLQAQLKVLQAQMAALTNDGETPVEVVEETETIAPDIEPEEPEVENPNFSMKRGFAGKYDVLDKGGEIVFSDTGVGAKDRCHDWIRQQAA